MHARPPAFTAILLLTAAMAGCAGGDAEPSGFKVIATPDDPVTEPFILRATATGDLLQWDMGDGRPLLEGKEVSYIYGFTDGVVKPKLIATTAGVRETFPPRTFILGNGQNQMPSFQMGLEWDWVTVGEPVSLTGAGSSDPDGDPLLFSWFCIRQSDIAPAGAGHSHGGAGSTFGARGPDPIPAIVLNGTVPVAEAELGDDLCSALASTTDFSTDATVRGSFRQTGIYKITMLAKDPKTPSIPGSRLIYVTGADEPRITAPVVLPFDGTFDYGVPTALDNAMTEADQRDTYVRNIPFQIHYPLQGFALDFGYAPGTGSTNLVTYHLVKPNGAFKDTAEQSESLNKGALYLDHGSGTYNLRVYGRQGADLSYDGAITLSYVTDPSFLFEDPTGQH